MRDASAAVLKKLGYDSSHVIGHKEWAGAENPLGINTQGKPDPGDMDMKWFRGEVEKAMLGVFEKFEKKETEVGGQEAPEPTDHALLQQIWEQLLGPEGKGWPQLGGRTLVDALAEVLKGDSGGHLLAEPEAATTPSPQDKPLARSRRAPAKKTAARGRKAAGAGSLQDA